MAKRSIGSSRPARPAAKNGARTSRRETDADIDFSDLPESTDEQLASMRRVGRPTLSERGARQLIAIRLDPDVLARFKRAAARRGIGYQTLINDVLAEHAPRA